MARQTIRTLDDMNSFSTTFSARLSSIAAAHDILMPSAEARADLGLMVDRQVGPYVGMENLLRVTGESISLAGECAHSVELSFGGSADLKYAVDGVVATLIFPKDYDHG